MKTYIGIVRDHSASMSGIARYAARDYNEVITSLKEAAAENSIDTIVTTVECGRGRNAEVRRDVVNSNVNVLQPIAETSYITDGTGTPLWDSIHEVTKILRGMPDANDPEVTFVVMVITDGEENRSNMRAATLASTIRELQNTDRWTFTFRVPSGYARRIVTELQVHAGNIHEWDGRSSGSIAKSTQVTQSAVRNLYAQRKSGTKSVGTFYADLNHVDVRDVQVNLQDVSDKVQRLSVHGLDNDMEIATFIARTTGKPYVKGTVFYQLTKTEKAVQDYKKIMIRDKHSGHIFEGAAARQMLGLPRYGDVRLIPGNTGNFDVFIQSTSSNRKVKSGSTLLLCPTATIDK